MVILRGSTKTMPGGMRVDAKDLWQAFLETGAPELYVLYAQMKKEEERHVFNCSGFGAESDQLQ